MIELNDDNDHLLFSVTMPSGRLILQYMEVLAYAQSNLKPDAQAELADIVSAIRTTARTKEVAAAASDHELKAAWVRITKAVETAGNG